MSGPAPKRSTERRRRNKDGIELETVSLDELIKLEIEVPVARDEWDPITKNFWDAFTRSGQAIFYEPTDWMSAYALMEILDRWLKPQEVKVGQIGSAGKENEGGDIEYVFEAKILAMPGGVISSIWKALGDLMAMEGPRRKLRIELERRNAMDAALGGSVPTATVTQSREDAFRRAQAARDAQKTAEA